MKCNNTKRLHSPYEHIYKQIYNLIYMVYIVARFIVGRIGSLCLKINIMTIAARQRSICHDLTSLEKLHDISSVDY